MKLNFLKRTIAAALSLVIAAGAAPFGMFGDAFLKLVYAVDWPMSGSGTSTDPYIIDEASDLDFFAGRIAAGVDCEDMYFKLGADLDLNYKIGDPLTPFCGVFDGGGHTLNADIYSFPENDYTAPFCNISGAEIKNLNITGSVSGGNYASGLVGISSGTGNKITNCNVSATVNGGANIGGLLAYGDSGSVSIENCVSVENCVFSGQLVGGSTAKGAFVGGCGKNSLITVKNCLYIADKQKDKTKLDLVKNGNGIVRVSDCYSTVTLNTDAVLVHTYLPVSGLYKIMNINGVTFYIHYDEPSFRGSGSENDPYLIANQNDWNEFADIVNEGIEISDKYFLLENDIDVDKTAGSPDAPFRGEFNGGGHTVYANISSTDRDYTALFGAISGAVIENLEIKGTIKGSDYTAALVGKAAGSGNRITGCTISAKVTGGDHTGGVVAYSNNAEITVENCIYKGLLESSGEIRVFLDEHDDYDLGKVINCLYIPKSKQNTDNLLVSGDELTDSCYTTVKGLDAAFGYTSVPYNEIYMPVSVNGTAFYLGTTSDLRDTYYFNNKLKGILPKVYPNNDLDGASLDCTITIKNSNNEVVETFDTPGTYTVNIVPEDTDTFKGEYNASFVLETALGGEGSKDSPYLINSDEDWRRFAAAVNCGTAYEGEYVNLTNDISIDAIAGTAASTLFKGIFDGGGHIMTADINENECSCVAPFGATYNAEIKNLTVSGYIKSRKNYVAGIVARATSSSISNCSVTAEITGTGNNTAGIAALIKNGSNISNCTVTGNISSNDSCVGGISCQSEGKNNVIENCLFKALISGGKRTKKGVFVSEVYDTSFISIKNCLYIADEEQNTSSLDLVDPSTTQYTEVINTYKTIDIGKYGKLCSTEPLEEGFYIKKNILNTDIYFETDISNIGEQYYCSGIPIKVLPVVKAYNEKLTEGTDYILIFRDDNNETVDKIDSIGTYSVTVCPAEGSSCYGSFTKSFEVINTANFSGSGTEESPFCINNASDWKTLAADVANGNDYSGAFFKLTANISVSKEIGTVSNGAPENPFCGNFDGGGNTLSVSITDKRNSGTAPFRCISGAYIHDLEVKGTAAGADYAGGLVGFSTGTDNRISNCTIHTKVSGDAYLGGILGNGLDSDIIIENCTFDGELTNGSDPKGAFAGWNEKNGTKLVNSCLYIIDSLQNTEGLDLICTDEESILLTDCYKTTPYCKYGTQVRSSKPKSDLCRPLMINGAQYYALPAFSFVDDVYSLEDGVIDKYPVLTDNKKTLEYGKDINVTILNSENKSVALPINSAGKYKVTVSAAEGSDYIGSCSRSFEVLSRLLNGSGTEESPYIIATEKDWKRLALYAQKELGEYIYCKMTDDIYVSQPIESLLSMCFDGGGHTLTFNCGTELEPYRYEYCAPFGHIENSVIKNLNIDGSIYTNKSNAAGIAGRSEGGCSMTDCNVDTKIYLFFGVLCCGGFVGEQLGEDTSFENCIFHGSIISKASESPIECSGFVGYSNEDMYFKNCIFAPEAIDVDEPEGYTFAENAVTENCYYTQALGEAQGERVCAITAPEGVKISGALDIPRVGANYGISGSEIKLEAMYGYSCSGLVVRDSDGEAVESTSENGALKFTMPAKEVTVSADTAPDPNVFISGDADLDSEVTDKDAAVTLKYISYGKPFFEEKDKNAAALKNADKDGNKAIDMRDVVIILESAE